MLSLIYPNYSRSHASKLAGNLWVDIGAATSKETRCMFNNLHIRSNEDGTWTHPNSESVLKHDFYFKRRRVRILNYVEEIYIQTELKELETRVNKRKGWTQII